ncbi:hypothetical protein COMA2_30317 [Candidatus Nitrospira nitrificans]|uniref:Uncharacterized protein n=1 Tax=Candidatus Nitrospira nitrificans TaxID=1742973 RepID=A0A0S4LLX7_9BACT|nr:hypothetical protein COMA2_30317 [Candidatus Nitrospira nitrificans]
MTEEHSLYWEASKDFTTDRARCICGWLCWSKNREEMVAAFDAHKIFTTHDRLRRRAELIEREATLHEIMWNETRDAARCKKEGCKWAMVHISIAKILNAFESHRVSEAEKKYW